MATVTLWLCPDCTAFAHGFSEHERGEDYPKAVIEAFSDPVRDIGKPGLLTAGTLEHDPQWCPRVDPETLEILDGDMGDCQCESRDFTWNRCDGCLSPVGGSRDAFTLWDES